MRAREWLVGAVAVAGVALALSLMGALSPGTARANPGVLYVDAAAAGAKDGSSWADAFTDLQQALDNAVSGDEIWVAAGVYTPTNTVGRQATFRLKDGVAIYGGFAGTETAREQRDREAYVTTLSGDVGAVGEMSDNVYHVVTADHVGLTAVLDGVTIVGGNANGSYPDNRGGGMYNDYASPVLSNVTFSSNRGLYAGGGMYNYYSHPTLNTVTFSGNQASSGDGGGMYSSYGSPTLQRVIFVGNLASVRGGGMYNYESGPELSNVVFSGNRAGQAGGGMANFNCANPTLNSVTFSGNDGGGLLSSYGSVTLSNCILWGNTGGPQIGSYMSAVSVAHSDVQDGYAGSANIDSAPLFVRDPHPGADGTWGTEDDDYGDLRLRPASPCIDTGATDGAPAADIRGLPRPAGAGYDMGAYEYYPFLVTKEATPDPVWAGSRLTYTIRITNLTGVDLPIVVTDTLPAHVTPGGFLTWTPTLAALEGVWMQQAVVTASVGYVGPLTNVVHVATTEGAAVVSAFTETSAVTSTGLLFPGVAATFLFTDAQGVGVTIQAPGEAVTETTILIYTLLPGPSHPVPAQLSFASYALALDAYRNGELLPASFTFETPIVVTIRYADANVARVDPEASLALYWWNEATGAWEDAACGPYERQTGENWVALPICHPGELALMGTAKVWVTWLPLTLRGYPLADVPDACPGMVAEIGRTYVEDLDHANDNDRYAFAAQAGQVYVLETGDLGPRADTILTLFAPDCVTPLAENDDIQWPDDVASRIVWEAPFTGIYYAMVRSYDWRVYGPGTGYTFRVDVGTGAATSALGARTGLPVKPLPLATPVPAVVPSLGSGRSPGHPCLQPQKPPPPPTPTSIAKAPSLPTPGRPVPDQGDEPHGPAALPLPSTILLPESGGAGLPLSPSALALAIACLVAWAVHRRRAARW